MPSRRCTLPSEFSTFQALAADPVGPTRTWHQLKRICGLIDEIVFRNRPVFQMSSSEEEAQSPELGASSSKDPPPPLESESEYAEEDEASSQSDAEKAEVSKKARDYKRPRAEWTTVLTHNKGEAATIDEDEMKLQILQAANQIMEASRMYKLPGHRSKETDLGMWKQKRPWTVDKGETDVRWYYCPMRIRFGCCVQIKVIENAHHITLLQRGEHDENSHSNEKDKSKHLKVQQLHAIRTGVRIAPSQSARMLRRNLSNLSPQKRVNPKLVRSVRRAVQAYRAELTLEQLNDLRIDDSFGSLVRFSDERLFAELLRRHNDEDDPYHFQLFEAFVIGRDINAKDDIVYLNFSSIWHLLNVLRNIAAGWLLQLNGDASYKKCRNTVALFSIGVNSLGMIGPRQ